MTYTQPKAAQKWAKIYAERKLAILKTLAEAPATQSELAKRLGVGPGRIISDPLQELTLAGFVEKKLPVSRSQGDRRPHPLHAKTRITPKGLEFLNQQTES